MDQCCDMMMDMNEKKENMMIQSLCTSAAWIIRYLSVYSVMLMVNALSMGVSNGYIMLVCAMVWLGCAAGNVLLEMSGKKMDEEHGWIVESMCLYVIMTVYNPLCGLAGCVISALQYVVVKRSHNRSVMYGLSVITAVVQVHMILSVMVDAGKASVGLTLLLMALFHIRSWLNIHPKTDGTLQRVNESDRQKTVAVVSLLVAVEYGVYIVMGMKLVRFGLYAVQQKALFAWSEADLWIAGLSCFCIVLRLCMDRFRIPDLCERERNTAPHLIGCMIVTALYSVYLMNVSHLIAGFSMLCLLVIIVVMYLLKRFTTVTEKKMNAIVSVWSHVYMIGVFLLVYSSYNGISVSSLVVGEIAGSCVCMHMLWSRRI